MHYGTVQSFDHHDGHGLILPDGGAAPVRVDRAAVDGAGLGQLAVDQRLAFDIDRHGEGPRAVNLWATWSGR